MKMVCDNIKVNKRILSFISIFLLFLVLMNSVSAQDNSTAGSFDDLQKEITSTESGGTLNLTNDYIYVNGSTDGVNISNPITINGNGFSIDGAGLSAIFNVNTTDNVSFYNIVFKNGNATYGGAISFLEEISNCNIENCTFESNLASESGGAIFFSKAAFENNIINNMFIGNTADFGASIWYNDEVSRSVFRKNDFINNSASLDWWGASLYINTASYFNLFDELNFIGNVAERGSGIYLHESYNDNFTELNFINNWDKYGAAFFIGLYCQGDVFDNLNFINNTGNQVSGALHLRDVEYSVFNDINFINNTGRYGGALTINAVSSYNNFTNINFINNSAYNGGAIFYYDESYVNVWENITFINNRAAKDGASIYSNRHLLNNTFNNFYFFNNTALNNSAVLWCGLLCEFNRFYNWNVSNNFAVNGSAFYHLSTSALNEFKNCNFTNNVANDTGLFYFSYLEANNYNSIQFINNNAKNFGGFFSLYYSEGNIVNCTFKNNTADYVSDIVYIDEANANIVNSTFDGKNHIYIGPYSRAILINNTELDSYVKNTFFVVNDGRLELENNSLTNLIVNNGDIISPTSIIVLNNETINVTSPEVDLYAVCVDDNDNYIISDYLTFNINERVFKVFFNGESFIDTGYILENPGIYLINASINSKLDNCTYKIGIINLTSKKEAVINASDAEIATGEFALIEVELPGDATGIVSAIVDNETYLAQVKDGKATLYIPPLDAGEYIAEITYSGDDNYDISDTTALITVLDEINVAAPDVIKYYHGEERFVVTVTRSEIPVGNESVEITINGVTYTRTTDKNGTASIALNMPSANYTAEVKVDDVSINSTVIILPTVNGTDITKVYGTATRYYATFLDSQGNYLNEGTNVTFNINGILYNRTVSGDKGLAGLNINLIQGNYVITAINLETGESSANNIIVIPKIIENNDVTKYYRNATQYTVKLIGDDGKAVGKGEVVRFNINGVFYERTTNESGIAQLNINLNPGDYIITAEYGGCLVSNNITVLPVLTAEDLTKKYGTDDPFEAKLVDGEGKAYANQKIEFNINGVFYYRVTDNGGVAKLNINLQAGEYIITSRYEDAVISNKVTVTS